MSKGYRGYVASRPIRSEMTPQHVQNLVIRSYLEKRDLFFKLSAVEYAMPSSYMVLETLLDELDDLDGIALFSLFMLPKRKERRELIYERLLSKGKHLHAALEDFCLSKPEDIQRFEDLIGVDQHASPSF